ncbi:MAG: hypothetical protein QW842_05835 [Candidatus Nezhaarchaeales archaeon]
MKPEKEERGIALTITLVGASQRSIPRFGYGKGPVTLSAVLIGRGISTRTSPDHRI